MGDEREIRPNSPTLRRLRARELDAPDLWVLVRQMRSGAYRVRCRACGVYQDRTRPDAGKLRHGCAG